MTKRRIDDSENDSLITNNHTASNKEIYCNIAPCEYTVLQNELELDQHYQLFHSNRCVDCLLSFPSEFYLDLHIMEFHDPFLQIKREKGEATLNCLDQHCKELFVNHDERIKHLVKDHNYPTNFDFNILQNGLNSDKLSLLK